MKVRIRMRGLLLTIVLLLIMCIAVLPIAATPSVSAKSAVLMDANSGRVLYQQNGFVRLPMASTTKIMTAVVALDSGNVKRTVTVSPKATGSEGSSIYLYPEEQLTLEQLLYALMLESANDAATAIAIEVAGSVEAFAELMNQKAAEIGLAATHFTNPHGLDHEEHYTTAYDLAKLTAYALQNPDFRAICGTVRKTIPLKGDEGTRVLINHNKMLSRYEGAIGVKTGFTKRSGRCLVSAAERDGLTLIAVTLSAPNDWTDHTAMLDFGFANYENKQLAEKEGFSVPLSVVGGTSEILLAANQYPVSVMMKKGHGTVTYQIEAPQILYAPIANGTVVGRVIWSCDGKGIASSPLIATHDIDYKKAERQGFFAWIASLFIRE